MMAPNSGMKVIQWSFGKDAVIHSIEKMCSSWVFTWFNTTTCVDSMIDIEEIYKILFVFYKNAFVKYNQICLDTSND